MNRDDTIRMAEELVNHIEEFAEKIAAAEREACAREAEKFLLMHSGSEWDAVHCAAAIRARGNNT